MSDDSREISVGCGLVALVDAADYPMISHFTWHARKGRHGTYADRNIKRGQSVGMHRMLLLPDPDEEVDHVNRNGLDNRRCNLRICTASQNHANQKVRADSLTGYKGVQFHRQTRKWCARISHKGARIRLGIYETPERAARAYDRAARELFGPFARLNFAEDHDDQRL